jgi:tetratricopeptide (TPR) repeat protein
LGEEAEAAYRRALELAPRSMAAKTGLALALAAQGKGAQATEAARAATRADTHSAEAEAALGLAALAQDPLDRSSEAVAAVQQARFLEPESPLVRLALGRVFESRGQLEQAASAYAEAVRLDPSWAAPRVAALGLRLREGDADGPLADLRALPEELRASGEAQLLLGKLLQRAGDAQGAKAALDLAVAALPGLAEAHAAHGSAAYDIGELALAVDASGRAVKLGPGNLAYRSSHGLFLAYDGRLEEGLSELLDVTGRAEGKTADAFVTLGSIYRSFEPPRVAEAVAAYREALKLEPRNAEAALGIARSYRAGKQWTRAVEAYERLAAQHRRLDGQAQLGIAWCYYRSGDSYKAGFYTGLAARAGADVGALRSALGKPVWAADELDELLDQLRSKHPGEQARAVKRLVALGKSGVPHLVSALQRRTTAIAVRETIVDGLGRLGPAAREALPPLDRLIEAGPGRGSDSRERARETKLVGAMREAVARIRGK